MSLPEPRTVNELPLMPCDPCAATAPMFAPVQVTDPDGGVVTLAAEDANDSLPAPSRALTVYVYDVFAATVVSL
jgi:hypothetical protein